jgi:hypothetical protein
VTPSDSEHLRELTGNPAKVEMSEAAVAENT